MNLNEGDKIASLAKIAREDAEAQAAAEETSGELPSPDQPPPTPEDNPNAAPPE